jgi:predicted GIY-YIG superfamily endonuclease
MAFIGNKEGKYIVYILYNGDNPIYIGMSSNMPLRITWHKRTKQVSHYAIFGRFANKQEALFVESTLIKFISFCDYKYLNHKFVNYSPCKISIQ